MYSPDIWYTAGHQNWCSVQLTTERFKFQVNRKAEKIIPFHQACDQAALLLRSDWPNKPLYLCFSGGVDSEVVANTLLRNGIEFIPFILEIENTNQAEAWFAHYWCKKNNVTPLVYQMSAQEFENKVLPYLNLIKNTYQNGTIVNLWMADYINNLGGYCVTAVGDINFDWDNKVFFNNIVDWISDVFDAGKHPSGFLSYTPELAASYVREFDVTLDEQYNKLNFYNVGFRPKIPYLHSALSMTIATKVHVRQYLQTNINTNRFEFGSKQQTLEILT